MTYKHLSTTLQRHDFMLRFTLNPTHLVCQKVSFSQGLRSYFFLKPSDGPVSTPKNAKCMVARRKNIRGRYFLLFEPQFFHLLFDEKSWQKTHRKMRKNGGCNFSHSLRVSQKNLGVVFFVPNPRVSKGGEAGPVQYSWAEHFGWENDRCKKDPDVLNETSKNVCFFREELTF